MDEGVALLAREPRLVRPGAIGDRLVVEEVLRLLGVWQGLPFRRLLRLLRLRRAASGSVSSTGSPVASTVATTVGIWPPSVFPNRYGPVAVAGVLAGVLVWVALATFADYGEGWAFIYAAVIALFVGAWTVGAAAGVFAHAGATWLGRSVLGKDRN
jgi:hypothetical protein